MIGCNHPLNSNFIKQNNKRQKFQIYCLQWSIVTCKTFNVLAYVEGLPIPSSSIFLTCNIQFQWNKKISDRKLDRCKTGLFTLHYEGFISYIWETIYKSNQIIAYKITPKVISYIWWGRGAKLNWKYILHIQEKPVLMFIVLHPTT